MTGLLLQLGIAAAVTAAAFGSGLWTGYEWKSGQVAEAELEARELRETDMRQQRQFSDAKAGQHAARVDKIANQLGDARAQIAKLSHADRCLDAGAVGVLNAVGSDAVRATAVEPAHAAGAFASAADVGADIASCRAGYARLSSQINQILDIEDRRHKPAPAPQVSSTTER